MKNVDIVVTKKNELLGETLEKYVDEFNSNYSKFVDGFWGCIKVISDADKQFQKLAEECPSAAKNAEKQFFSRLLTRDDKSLISKMKTCARNIELLKKYRGKIPENMTSFYLVARHPDAEKILDENTKIKPGDDLPALSIKTTSKEMAEIFAIDNGAVKKQIAAPLMAPLTFSFVKREWKELNLERIFYNFESDIILNNFIERIKDKQELEVTFSVSQ